MSARTYPLLLAALGLMTLPAAAHGYSLQTAVSDSCHERITVSSLDVLLDLVDDVSGFEVPDDPLLRQLLGRLQFPGTEDASLQVRFVMFSIIIGVRSPDTDGHSTFNLAALRRLHADPAPRGQYAHALRGPGDDGIAGDLAAVDGTIAAILDEVQTGASLSAGGVIADKPAYLDHYGVVDVPVALFAWHVGRALHALQDAHAHMIWDAEVEHIVGVLNYIDAVEGRLEDADGLAHSDALDDCHRDDVAPLVEAATRRTRALTLAIVEAARTRDGAALRAGLAPCVDDATDRDACGWIVYNPPCRAAIRAGDTDAVEAVCCDDANDFCGSPYAAIARQEAVGPYLGCATAPAGQSGGWAWGLGLLGLAWLGRRRRFAAPTALALLALARPAVAAEADEAADAADAPPRLSVVVEGHGSALDDRVDAAILSPAFGYGVRAGWQTGRWRFGLHVDRDYWVSVEYGARVDGGVLDVAAFAEGLFFDDYVRVAFALGTSTLMFDTELHSTGNTGVFSEIRPLGLRFPLGERLWLVLDPFTTTVVMPAIELDDRLPSLRKVQHRTIVGIEGGFL